MKTLRLRGAILAFFGPGEFLTTVHPAVAWRGWRIVVGGGWKQDMIGGNMKGPVLLVTIPVAFLLVSRVSTRVRAGIFSLVTVKCIHTVKGSAA